MTTQKPPEQTMVEDLQEFLQNTAACAVIQINANNQADQELIPTLLEGILRGEDEDGDKVRFLQSLYALGSLQVAAA